MAYVTPTSKTTGDLIAATDWNQNTVDNPIAIKAQVDAIVAGGKYACDGRLSLTTGVPVTTADVTAATTLYWVPYQGNQLALYSGTAWVMFAQAQLSIAVPATTNQMYDVFIDYNAGTPALSLTAWTNDTTRATALTTQDSVYVLTGSTGKRYVGSFRTTGVSGQTEDSIAKRYLYNYYNRAARPMRVLEATDSWTYTTFTVRQARGSTANQLDMVIGVSEDTVTAVAHALSSNATASSTRRVLIGLDSTTAKASGSTSGVMASQANLSEVVSAEASFTGFVGEGRHILTWLEDSNTLGTSTFYGDSGGVLLQSGIDGVVWG